MKIWTFSLSVICIVQCIRFCLALGLLGKTLGLFSQCFAMIFVKWRNLRIYTANNNNIIAKVGKIVYNHNLLFLKKKSTCLIQKYVTKNIDISYNYIFKHKPLCNVAICFMKPWRFLLLPNQSGKENIWFKFLSTPCILLNFCHFANKRHRLC